MIWAAVRAVASHERSLRWRSLLVVAVIVGVLGGLVVGGVGLTRRTASAPHRLLAQVVPGDAEVRIFGAPSLVEVVAALDQVERAWPAQMAVARLEGPAITYVGVLAGPERPEGMLDPVVVSGRPPRPGEPHEVVVTEAFARSLGYRAGDRFEVTMLTAEEVGQFDVGFGEPDGPRMELEVTGVVRVPNGVLANSPILGTPAFAERYSDVAAGTYLAVDLVDGGGGGSYEGFTRAVAAAAEPAETPPGAEEFSPATVMSLSAGTREAAGSARMLVGGLVVAVAIAALAGTFALAQALSRHHGATVGDQAVELALGMTATERTMARVLPAVPAAVVATVAAASVAAAGAALEPIGVANRYEPQPGWLPEPSVLVVGSLLVGFGFLALVAATAHRAGRRAPVAGAVAAELPLGLLRWAPGWALTGATFALSRGGSRRSVPIRSSLVGVTVGVAGLVASLSFGASLHRLENSPLRWGWAGDLVVIDTTDDLQALLLADPRIDALTDIRSTSVDLEGTVVPAQSFEPVAGSMSWTIVEGRGAEAADEMVVGTRLASRLDLRVGDRVDVGGHRSSVVGLGIGPDVAGEGMANAVLVPAGRLDEVAMRTYFREALVRVADGADHDALVTELSQAYEIEVRSPPTVVRDLVELGRLPELLGGFLAVLGGLALSHALVITGRHRARDLAVLQALGSTPRQAGAAIAAMALTCTSVGSMVGLPLGWALARLVWGTVARGAGLAPDLLLPLSAWSAVLGAALVAVGLAAFPARAAIRSRPAGILRTE